MHWEFVIAGYVITFGGLALYTLSILRRGRRLTRQVPEDRRRFLD